MEGVEGCGGSWREGLLVSAVAAMDNLELGHLGALVSAAAVVAELEVARVQRPIVEHGGGHGQVVVQLSPSASLTPLVGELF